MILSKPLKNLQNNFNTSVTLATLSVTVLAKGAAHVRNELCHFRNKYSTLHNSKTIAIKKAFLSLLLDEG